MNPAQSSTSTEVGLIKTGLHQRDGSVGAPHSGILLETGTTQHDGDFAELPKLKPSYALFRWPCCARSIHRGREYRASRVIRATTRAVAAARSCSVFPAHSARDTP